MFNENIKPFLAHKYLLRRWFELVSIADPLVGKALKNRLDNQHLNLDLVSPGLISEVRRDAKDGRVIIENTRTVTKGIINRRSYGLPSRLIFRAPHIQVTLYAPYVSQHGKLRAGKITVEMFGGKLPHEAGESITATMHFDSVAETYQARKPKLSVTKTVDALFTEDVASMLRLQPLIEAFTNKPALCEMSKYLFELVKKNYATNDEWSKDLKRLALLTNNPVPEGNQSR